MCAMTRYIIDKETGQAKAKSDDQAHLDAGQEANRVEAFSQGRLQALEEFSSGRALVVFNLETRTVQATSRSKALFPKTVAQLEQSAKGALKQLEEELEQRRATDEEQLDLLPSGS